MTSTRRQALVVRFRQSAREQLDSLDRSFVALEKQRDDSALALEVLRTIHTLKGDSKIVGFGQVNRVAHRTEDVLLWAKQHGFDIPAAAADVVFQGFDLMRHLVAAEPDDASRQEQIARFEASAAEVLGAAVAAAPPAAPSAAPAAIPTAPPAAPPAPQAKAAPEAAPEEKKSGADAEAAGESVRVATERLASLTSLAGTLLVRQEQIEARVAHLDELRRALDRALAGGEEPAEPLVREMGQGLSLLQSEAFECRMHLLSLQEEVRQMRLRHLGDLFFRYPRAVRDLARAQQKAVRLETEGNEVAVDKQVLDQLDKVLLHLVRNAVDHGLESPEQRAKAGKPAEGVVKLSARPVGGQIEVSVSDDGRGMDPAAIRAAAVRKGLFDPAAADQLTEAELVRLVFEPGFSTREQASDVSGRGIGLDVVTKLTEQLGGAVRVESRLGQGCRFVLTLPVSLALTQVLLIDLRGRVFALPAVAASSAERLPADAARPSGEGLAVAVGGELVPMVDLAVLLGLPGESIDDEDLRVAVLENGGQRLAVRVERFLGLRSVVVAALDPFLAGVRVASGTAELEGGQRALLLCVPELFKLAGRSAALRHGEEAARTASKRVLVVDDSPIIREIVCPMLERLGYQVLQAVDGQKGFEMACEHRPDLVMTDLEMPVLDGYGLIEKLRAAEVGRALPVVVLSTRGAEQDKRRAMEAGANAYLIKSTFDESELSRTLHSLLA